ncbi:hypothetical protein ES703_56415 [subsurface metagenome]
MEAYHRPQRVCGFGVCDYTRNKGLLYWIHSNGKGECLADLLGCNRLRMVAFLGCVDLVAFHKLRQNESARAIRVEDGIYQVPGKLDPGALDWLSGLSVLDQTFNQLLLGADQVSADAQAGVK